MPHDFDRPAWDQRIASETAAGPSDDSQFRYNEGPGTASALRETTVFDGLFDRVDAITRRAGVNSAAIGQIATHAGNVADALGCGSCDLARPAAEKSRGELAGGPALPTGALPRLTYMLDVLEAAVCGQSIPIEHAVGEVRRLEGLA